MHRLNLAQANALIDAAFAHGAELGLKPLTVAVLDAGGHLLAFAREDNSSNLRPQIAQGTGIAVLHIAEMLDWATGGPAPSAFAAPAS